MASRYVSLNIETDEYVEQWQLLRSVTDFAAELDAQNKLKYIQVSSTIMPDGVRPVEENLRVDENTLFLVDDTIMNVLKKYQAPTSVGDISKDIITSLQNAGILFREHA